MTECGLSFNTPNAKIVGGSTAVAHSWPSIAYVRFFYKATYFINDYNVYITDTFAYLCGGTLIDRKTILTAEHCIVKEVEITYNNKIYYGKVYTNSDYPTIASMYTVYLGLQDRTVISNLNISPGVKMSVSQVIEVN